MLQIQKCFTTEDHTVDLINYRLTSDHSKAIHLLFYLYFLLLFSPSLHFSLIESFHCLSRLISNSLQEN